MHKITVYYDGACPICLKELAFYRRFEGKGDILWYDITGKDEALRSEGIDPRQALQSLHIRNGRGEIVTNVDAFILLWANVWPFKPFAWIASVPPVKFLIKEIYGYLTRARLRRTGRF